MLRNRESEYRDVGTIFDFWLTNRLEDLNTVMPALIVEYDRQTKRAKVQPALRQRLSETDSRRRMPIVDVPVVHPAGGGYAVHFPLQADDPVLVLFSQRGITAFKKAFKESDPDLDSLLAPNDAIAVPGFGAIELSEVDDEALVMQTENGEQYVSINSDGNIKVTATTKITLTAPTVVIDADSQFTVESPSVDFNS